MDYVKDVLVSIEWVVQNFQMLGVCFIEVDEDILFYEIGYLFGVVKFDWQIDLWYLVECDFIELQQVSELLGKLGIKVDDIIVFYGDKSNWWVSYVYWFLIYSGVSNFKIMNGGCQKWVVEGCEMIIEVFIVIVIIYFVL